ncbi:MAG: hypothetical protein LUQ65_10575 [Candidatus Helarchaeota archaeon]|nr:hypothetical protein [Candidatus Helarchaeota archaeon]
MQKPDIYVISRFLEKLWLGNSEFKVTQLQMATGLNYNVFTKYLNWLEEKNLVLIEDKDKLHKTIKITKKGIDIYKRLVILLGELIE